MITVEMTKLTAAVTDRAIKAGVLLTDRKDIAKALNFNKYPVLTFDIDNDKGSKAKVLKKHRDGEIHPYNCNLYCGAQTKTDGTFWLMTKASMLSKSFTVNDALENADYANAPIIEEGKEVAILVYSKKLAIKFIVIVTPDRVDPSYSTATRFEY